MRTNIITRADLLTVIEEVGFGKAVIVGADHHGVIVNGYLDLAAISSRLNRLIELRSRQRSLVDHEQAR